MRMVYHSHEILEIIFHHQNGFFPPRVKRPGREADYSSPYGAEVKNGWYYTSTSPYLPSWGAQGPHNLPALV